MTVRRSLYSHIRGWFESDDTARRPPIERSLLSDLGYTVTWALAVVLLCSAALFSIAWPQKGWPLRLAFVGVCSLVALAAGAAGGAAGFLFGIPRTLAGGADAGGEGEARHIRSNTNLEQISDWLTKIVVGATLVQLDAIWPGLIAFGQEFEKAIRQLPGLDGLAGLSGLIPILVLLSFVTGFLTLYLQTRTFLTIMFARTERVVSDSQLGMTEADVLKQAALRIAADGDAAQAPEAARTLARRVLGQNAPDESNLEAMKQRGFAQIVLGQTSDGASTLKRVYQLTKDEELGRLASRLLAQTERPGEAKDLLGKVDLPSKGTPLSEKATDALLNRMFAALYEPEPLGFNEALRIAEYLKDQPVVTESPRRLARLALYSSAALGQCYRFSGGEKSEEDLAAIRARALEAVRTAIASDPTTRAALKAMLQGSGQDDDLAAFQADPEFKAAILDGG